MVSTPGWHEPRDQHAPHYSMLQMCKLKLTSSFSGGCYCQGDAISLGEVESIFN